MHIFRYGKRYAKVLLAAPGASSVAVCLLGVLLAGVVVVCGRREPRQRVPVVRVAPAKRGATHTAASLSMRPTQAGGATRALHPEQARSGPTRIERSRPHLHRAVFRRPIAGNQFEFLKSSAEQPADDAVLKEELVRLIKAAAPYTPFHYGIDRPLPHAMESVLFLQPMSMRIRKKRYVTVSNRDPQGNSGRRRGFLWIDLRQGIVLGGIFFYPSNGEPTPTLTIFSRQVQARSLGMSQLPEAFVQDLNRWSAATGLPPVVTRYFIDASGEKIVLTHDEDYCSPSAGKLVPPGEGCRQMKARAVAADKAAARFLSETHHASNATMHMVADGGRGAAFTGNVRDQ